MRPETRQYLNTFLTQLQSLPVKNIPSIRRLRRNLSKQLAESHPREVLEAAHALIDAQHRWVGYELLTHHSAALTSLRPKDIESLGEGMAAWDHVDTFACYISGPCWRNHQVSDAAIRRWTKSPDRWWRRAALVSTVPLNMKSQGGSGDVPKTLDICERLVADRDDMIEKALSWALRCIVQHDAKAVRNFLDAHDAVLAARVKREVRNKLRTGLKNPRR